jgi:ribose 5-phosphate isomerase A
VIADCLTPFSNRAAFAATLDGTPGVIGHGLFPPELSADVLIARAGEVEHRVLR